MMTCSFAYQDKEQEYYEATDCPDGLGRSRPC
jgi:hypothetical protein